METLATFRDQSAMLGSQKLTPAHTYMPYLDHKKESKKFPVFVKRPVKPLGNILQIQRTEYFFSSQRYTSLKFKFATAEIPHYNSDPVKGFHKFVILMG